MGRPTGLSSKAPTKRELPKGSISGGRATAGEEYRRTLLSSAANAPVSLRGVGAIVFGATAITAPDRVSR
jgi:hypothetical protein